MEKSNVDELNFLWEKTTSHFRMIYNFKIPITRIHFTICKVWNNNSNPVGDVYFNT